jgi:hypothetical protein
VQAIAGGVLTRQRGPPAHRRQHRQAAGVVDCPRNLIQPAQLFWVSGQETTPPSPHPSFLSEKPRWPPSRGAFSCRRSATRRLMARRPSVEPLTPDRHLPRRTERRRAMTDYDNTKKAERHFRPGRPAPPLPAALVRRGDGRLFHRSRRQRASARLVSRTVHSPAFRLRRGGRMTRCCGRRCSLRTRRSTRTRRSLRTRGSIHSHSCSGWWVRCRTWRSFPPGR